MFAATTLHRPKDVESPYSQQTQQHNGIPEIHVHDVKGFLSSFILQRGRARREVYGPYFCSPTCGKLSKVSVGFCFTQNNRGAHARASTPGVLLKFDGL